MRPLMTLGYYSREDLPFNYAADAFTVCDQHFLAHRQQVPRPTACISWSGVLRKDSLTKTARLAHLSTK